MCFYWIISLVSSTISASVLEYITLIRILLFIYCCYLKEVALSFPFGENGGGAHEFLFFLIHFLLPAILVLQLNNLRRRHSRLTAGHKYLAVSYRSFMLSLLSIHPVLSCTHDKFRLFYRAHTMILPPNILALKLYTGFIFHYLRVADRRILFTYYANENTISEIFYIAIGLYGLIDPISQSGSSFIRLISMSF